MAIKLSSLFGAFCFFLNRVFIWLWQKRIFLMWTRSEEDFVLRVAPIKDKSSKAYRDYHPPPRYGIPAGKGEALEEKAREFGRYGLYLWPSKIAPKLFWSVLLTHSLTPLVFLLPICGFNSITTFSFWAIYLVSLLSIAWLSLIVLNIIFSNSPTVLSRIWANWPESQYDKFLNVPHLSTLAFKDIGKYEQYERRSNALRKKVTDKKSRNDLEDEQTLQGLKRYWKPDSTMPMKYQSAYYARGTRTLQEVLLHLAVFDFLFEAKTAETDSQNPKNDSDLNNSPLFFGSVNRHLLKQHSMFFVFPILIHFFILLGLFLLYALIYTPPSLSNDYGLLLQYPFFFVVPLVSWFSFSFFYAMRVKKSLMSLYSDIKEEYFNAHLDLVPQQILHVLSELPDHDHIREGISNIERVQGLIQTVAIVSFFALMEIFSSGVSESNDKEKCWLIECIKKE